MPKVDDAEHVVRSVARSKLLAAVTSAPRGTISPVGQRAGGRVDRGGAYANIDGLQAAEPAFAHAPRESLALAGFQPGFGLSPGEAGMPLFRAHTADRWSGAAWMLWRGQGDSAESVRRERLGGAQAGVRIDYLLAPSSSLRPTLYGRVSTALRGIAAAEVAAGIAIRPKLPFAAIIAVERRQAVSPGGRSDFSLLAAGGIKPISAGHGFRLDGYGQAGFVGLERRDAFADGRLTRRLTLERPLAASRRDIAVGAAIWGGAQPGVSRLDIGPQASMRLRLGDASMRLGAEWRARVAGDAAPSSGMALSLGADF